MRISLSAGVRGFSSAVERRRCLATGVMLRGGTSEIARYAIRRLAVEEQPLPDLECHERPKLLAPIRSAIVRQNDLLNSCRVEHTSRTCALAHHELIDERTEGSTQPTPDRHGESHLSPREDFRWQRTCHWL